MESLEPTTIGSVMNNNLTEKTISLPFRITGSGSVNSVSADEKIWADRVRSVLGTMKTERIYRPTFGTNISKSVLDVESALEERIEKEVLSAFSIFLPSLSVYGLTVNFDSNQSMAIVDVTYTLPNQTTKSTVNSVIAIDGNKPISEEKR